MDWKDRVDNVFDVNNQSVRAARRERVAGQGGHRLAALLGQDHKERTGRRRDQERRLLGEQTHHGRSTEAAQGPIIQEQQQERQSDERLFRRQATDEQDDRSDQTPSPAPLDVIEPRPDRPQAKKCAQDVFALGDPGHRFDVQGVEGEQSRNERALALISRRFQQHAKEHDRVQRVKQDIGEMISPGAARRSAHRASRTTS